MTKLLGNLVIIVSSLWSRCSTKKTMREHSRDMAPQFLSKHRGRVSLVPLTIAETKILRIS